MPAPAPSLWGRGELSGARRRGVTALVRTKDGPGHRETIVARTEPLASGAGVKPVTKESRGWRPIHDHAPRKSLRIRKLVALYCALSTGALVFFTVLWLNAIRYADGRVVIYTDALGEGLVEAVLFALLSLCGSVAWGQSMLDWRAAEIAARRRPGAEP